MGNMSNPNINRWGLNLFWYKFWFNDKNTSKFYNLDNLIEKFIIFYLNYGIFHFKNFLSTNYWNFLDKNINLKFKNFVNFYYFRKIEYKNRIINQYKTYKLRKYNKNIYNSRIWILKFQKWLIINYYYFQPLKQKLKKLKKPKKHKNNFSIQIEKKTILLLRLKYFFKLVLLSIINKNFLYKF